MDKEEVLKDWRGKIIGYIITDKYGNQTIKDFYRRTKSGNNKNAF